jgi:PEP-CTERM motif
MMKKMASILALLTAGATLAYGQGTVIFNNLSPAYNIFTNRIVNGISVARGPTSKATPGGNYYYALLIADYTGTLTTTNPLDPAFTFTGVYGTNSPLAVGALAGAGGGGGTTIPGWGAPTGPSYDTAERNYFLIVGWSANLGNTWGAISNRLVDPFFGAISNPWTGDPFVGVSALGNGYSGGGPFSLPAPSLFGVTLGMPGGLTSGFDLLWIIPEPSTFTLAGLGAVAMLICRRRDQTRLYRRVVHAPQ